MELFLIGSFWFWALIVAEIVLLFIFIENENGIGATVSMVVFACCLHFFGNVDIIGYVMANPWGILAVVAAYFMLGGVWGVVKWWLLCRDRLEEYDEAKEEFLKSKGCASGTKVVPEEFKLEWTRSLKNNHNRFLAKAPRVRENKARVLRWMSFWPISFIWTLINDFVKRVFKSIYRRIAGWLQRISDNMFASAQNDLVDDEALERAEEIDRQRRMR